MRLQPFPLNRVWVPIHIFQVLSFELLFPGAFVYTPYIKFYGTTPPTVGEFHNFNPGKIIVPRGYIDTYKNASTMWQRLANQTWEEFDP